MATKKPTTKIVPQQKVVNLVQKPETFVGAITLVALGVIGFNSLQNPSSRVNSIGLPTTMPTANITAVATPSATQNIVQPTQSEPTASPSAVVATPAPLAAIEKLADTSSNEVVIAGTTDSFWSIAKRTCGSGTQGYRIKEENGYSFKHLQPGDEIEVRCL